jgi:uncharacterized protein (DUF1330 family)
MAESIVNIVASECTGDEAKFNKWYNEVHIPMLLKFKGLKRASRYKQLGENKEQATYLAFYEFENKDALDALHASPEFAAAMEEMKETWKDGGFESKWVVPYEHIKTWER